jgi:isochorismate pyruvate lyase
MSEVRAGIDRLDCVLVGLIAERQAYIERAAQIKASRSDVRDEGRIAEVMSNIAREAEAAGLSLSIAMPVWRLLVECSIAHEFEAFDREKGS